MHKNEQVKTSKFLSYVLRHRPDSIGLTLDAQGWANIDQLLKCAEESGRVLSRELLENVVRENDKQRFSFNEDQTCIRANQGHSLSIDLALEPLVPPANLYHGTAARFLDSIREQGLLRRNRQYVHLSIDEVTAVKVGQRHGEPVVLVINAAGMDKAGYPFFQSENGVWLTGEVPASFIQFP